MTERSQPVARLANGAAAKAAQIRENRCRRLRPIAAGMPSKEGVDGSSPSEGLQKRRKTALFVLRGFALSLNMRSYGALMEFSGSERRPRRCDGRIDGRRWWPNSATVSGRRSMAGTTAGTGSAVALSQDLVDESFERPATISGPSCPRRR